MSRGDNFYISIVEKTDPEYHRSKIIIHRPIMFYHAEFNNIKQLDTYANTLGFTYKKVEERKGNLGLYERFEISHKFIDSCGGGFWKVEDLPSGVKPIKLLSNGSIVTGYYLNDGETIEIFRPNPNAKEVYKPLDLQDHIAHTKSYGLY